MKTFYLVLAVTFLVSLLAFAYVGHFTRYMADDYCLAANVRKLGFTQAQTQLYLTWTGRYSYGFLMSIAELIGPATVPVGPLIALICWLGAAVWLIYQLALIAHWPHPLLTSSLMAELIIFVMLNGADNIVQSFYWQGGIVNYVVPLIMLTTYAGIVSYAFRTQLRGGAVVPLLILSALLIFLAGGLTEAYGVLQTGGLVLSLFICFKLASEHVRRALFPFLIAGLVSSLIAISIVALAPGNKFRQSNFPPSPNVFRLTKLSLYYTAGFVATEIVHSPLTILSLLLFPVLLTFGIQRSKSNDDSNLDTRKTRRLLLFLPAIGLFLIFICCATGVYSVSGPLPERARFIPEFVSVCTAVCWVYFASLALSRRFAAGTPKSSWLRTTGLAAIVALVLLAPLLATSRTLRLVSRARASASIWDQMDHDVRVAKARGSMDLTVPAVADVETRLGARQTELQIEPDAHNWKNKCMALYYGVDSITGR